MTNVKDEMKATTDYAIKLAKEKFGQDLDISERSIGKLDDLLSQAYQNLSSRMKDEKTNLAISRTANIWGTYLGEIMRHEFGGSWVLRGSERFIAIKGFEFWPIDFVFWKITSHPEYSARGFFAETSKKIISSQVERPQSQYRPEFINSPQAQSPVNKQQNAFTIDKKVIFAFAGIGGALLLAVICVIGFLLLRGSGISAEFRSNLNNFLIEAEKLNVMTEQGVSNDDYRNQLAEVKSAYSLLNGSWPSSLNTEKNMFDEAIKGWELTLEVWDYGLADSAYPFIFLPENSTLLKECTDYTNSNPELAKVKWVDEWIGVLMSTAGQYFEQGQTTINTKLK
ncbi:MAG: hypothetical protein IPM31_07405 [Anaerolineae bacterium]|nr:hypothetical protein [Anaerolineae bacterium]MBL8104721.1 hypothetical protein [Anaerolineales bacterium]MCC7189243.1 hypothetical protein [Anaerolineales bacterium]